MVKNEEGLRSLEICRSLNMTQFRSTVLWVGYVVGEIYLIRMNVTQRNDPEKLVMSLCVEKKIHQTNHVFELKALFLH
jgi:hypothetical protein